MPLVAAKERSTRGRLEEASGAAPPRADLSFLDNGRVATMRPNRGGVFGMPLEML
jgi:hypothetical protein